MNKIICGDCLEEMKKLEDNSVDAVITDPPAGISFMGKGWDTFTKSNKSGNCKNNTLIGFQDFICKVFLEVQRVLKPGGHCLVWAIPRTSHHTAMGLERAGFEIRDIIMHLFGCLSEDTEILTSDGWVPYHKYKHLNTLLPILIYNIKNDIYKWEIPKKWNEYKIKDTCYRIKSNFTDQLVSKNHCCVVKRKGKFIFKFAETLECEEDIPFLESMPDLPPTISNLYEGTGITKQRLSELYYEEKGKVEQGKIQKGVFNMSKMSNTIQTKKQTGKRNNSKVLFDKMLRTMEVGKSRDKKTFEENQQIREAGVDKGEYDELFKKNEWGEKSIVERGHNLFQKKGKLWKIQNKICSMSERIFGYGKKGWLCNGTSVGGGKENKQMPVEDRGYSSQRPQSREQQYKQFNAIQYQQGTQKVRGIGITRAKITKEKYSGIIFCPTVSTECFIARRKGKIFITGNSGFPKSLNVGKQIDKIQGNEREIIGEKVRGDVEKAKQSGVTYAKADANKNNKDIFGYGKETLTKGNSEWEGWGTALKPGAEHWILCRKPLSEKNVALNVLKWGTGGINIDDCKIRTEENLNGGTYSKGSMQGQIYGGGINKNSSYSFVQPEGRFPANVILECTCDKTNQGQEKISGGFGAMDIGMSDTGKGKTQNYDKTKSKSKQGNYKIHTDPNCPCYMLDEQTEGKVGNGHWAKTKVTGFGEFGNGKSEYFGVGRKDKQKGGASRFFYCAKPNKTERNFGCEELEEKESVYPGANSFDKDGNRLRADGSIIPPLKSRNNHPTVKSLSLMEYLIKLISREGAVVLDPFLGSGTTAVACEKLNRNWIGIEKDEEYCKIANARINAWREKLNKKGLQKTL